MAKTRGRYLEYNRWYDNNVRIRNKARDRASAKRHYFTKRRDKIDFHLYGLPPGSRDRMLREQGGLCAICGTDKPGQKTWSIDHDHKTGRVRGLLCHRCNSGLGYLMDSPLNCVQAAIYLVRHGWLDSRKG